MRFSRAFLGVVIFMLVAPLSTAGVHAQMVAQGDGTTSITLDNPFLNNNPGALLIVSPSDFNAEYGVDVYYDTVRWKISANGPTIPSTAHFWVLGFDGDSGFRHLTTAGNTTGQLTRLDDPRLNGHPEAMPIVTRERSSTGVPVPFPFGTWYDTTAGKWTIFYEDTSKTMPLGATFSVFVPGPDDQSYIHTATAGNVNSNYTVFDSAGIDQSRPHRIFITQRWIGTYNDAWVGVGWLFSFLFGNVDGSSMPVGASFNVYIAPVFDDGFEMGSTVLWSSAVP